MNKLTQTLVSACQDGRITICHTKPDAFYVRGVNGNRPSAYSLASLVERHAKARSAEYRLLRDAYKQLRRNFRTGWLLIEVSDPVCRDLEVAIKSRSVKAAG